jgi:serine/threonine protein kinase
MSEIDIWKKYKKNKIIGIGNHSIVYKAKNKETGKYVAIKEIQKYKINIKELKEEIEEIQKINLDNIVKIKEIIELKNIYNKNG